MSEWTKRNLSDLKLDPIDVLIFGGTGGLGRAIGKSLASAGAKVTVVGQTFRDEGVPNIQFIKGDLSSIESSKQLANSIDVSKTDVVLFTTGIFAAYNREETNEGLEKDMAVSYLNRLAILNIIAPKLSSKINPLGFGSRIFLMGFPGNNQLGNLDNFNQEKSYGSWEAHMNTVAGNEALVTGLKGKLNGVNIFGLNPGFVKTGIRGNLFGNGYLASGFESLLGWFTPSPEQFGDRLAPLIVAPELSKHDGAFFNQKTKEIPASKGFTVEHAEKVLQVSKDLLKSKGIDV